MSRPCRITPLLLLCSIACKERNPYYCDEKTPCEDSTHLCMTEWHECVPQGKFDLSVDGTQVGARCARSVECTDLEAPICDGASGRCRPCAGPSDDAICATRDASTARCGGAGRCVACREGSDCTNTVRPICGNNGSCAPCTDHPECPSLVCNSDGSCAAASTIRYVDNRGGSCRGGHSGTRADPDCEIQEAIDRLGTATVVRVIGSTSAYGPVAVQTSSPGLRLVGPGGWATTTATIRGGNDPGVSVTGKGAVVVIDGFDIAATLQDGVSCSNSSTPPRLTILRSQIHNATGVGISTWKCDITLDRNKIGPANSGGGIALNDSTYTITNCFVVENGNQGPAVAFSGVSTGLFRHNTVAKNGGVDTVGGVGCNTAITAIESSIIWMNSKGMSGSQFAGTGSCEFSDVLSDQTLPGTGNRTGPAPNFLGAGDYHLDPAKDNSGSIDQIADSPVDHDFDGTARPQRGGWDIGAHEVR